MLFRLLETIVVTVAVVDAIVASVVIVAVVAVFVVIVAVAIVVVLVLAGSCSRMHGILGESQDYPVGDTVENRRKTLLQK